VSPYPKTHLSHALAAAAAVLLVPPAPLSAQAEPKAVLSGRCQYPERVVQYRNETALILCDTASIERGSAIATLAFSQRSWGSMAQFSGAMAGDRMTVFPRSITNRPLARGERNLPNLLSRRRGYLRDQLRRQGWIALDRRQFRALAHISSRPERRPRSRSID